MGGYKGRAGSVGISVPEHGAELAAAQGAEELVAAELVAEQAQAQAQAQPQPQAQAQPQPQPQPQPKG